MDEREELIQALKNFKNAWFQLQEAWEDYPEDVIEFKEYPFEKSFDDYRVEPWVQEFTNSLEK